MALGSGQITNVFGWRAVEHESLADIDSTIAPTFHLFAYTDQEQVSNELRYSGWLRSGWQATFGVYFFVQDIRYRERRLLRSKMGAPFGGDQEHRTAGVFVNNDFELNSNWVLTLGARYTLERKDVEVAIAGNAACAVVSHRCAFDFKDGDSWRNVTPKIGLQRWLGSSSQLYGHYTKGFRSGGYNLRNTSPVATPGPFDEEEQDSVEVGFKSEFARGRVRLNVAAFRNQVYGMQRQVTRADLGGWGCASHREYRRRDDPGARRRGPGGARRSVDPQRLRRPYRRRLRPGPVRLERRRFHKRGDERLRLPRLAELTFGAEGRYARNLGARGRLAFRVSVAHRDDSEITDDNLGVLDGGDVVDASVAFSPSDSLTLTLYGRNLLDEVFRRSDFDLTGLVDSTYSPLKEGRVLGLAMRGRL